jgi:hypothetical protein
VGVARLRADGLRLSRDHFRLEAVVGGVDGRQITDPLWHTPNHGDRGNGQGWDLYYLKGPNHRLQGTLKLERFLEATQSKKLIAPDHFVASVEFGNELMSGSGTTWVSDFGVVVTPR